jgi:hypothetical protein
MLISSFIIFTIVALYLDEVIPNEMGTHKDPLFFLRCEKKIKDKRTILLEDDPIGR